MSKVFWDVLIDCNRYRVFETELAAKENLALMDVLEKATDIRADWQPLRLNLFEEEGKMRRVERKKPLADFMHGKVMPVLNTRAREIIEPLVKGQVEFLLCETSVGPYYGLHVKYVDCLDTKHAQVIRFKSSGHIMEVEKYAFHWERLEGIHIFRLPELGLSRLFVSDEFRRVVEENGLTGLEFYPVPLVEE